MQPRSRQPGYLWIFPLHLHGGNEVLASSKSFVGVPPETLADALVKTLAWLQAAKETRAVAAAALAVLPAACTSVPPAHASASPVDEDDDADENTLGSRLEREEEDGEDLQYGHLTTPFPLEGTANMRLFAGKWG